ncbi:MAG: IPT/TIG domain-containing protein [Solirubrobacteraceae bacterium]
MPPAAKLSALAVPALPAAGGIEGSGLTPAELQSAYKLPSASAGEGQTVAIIDAFDDPTAESDLATYRSAYGLPACTAGSGCFRKVNQTGGSEYPPVAKAENGDWELEESLDLDMVSAVCPKCRILLVEATSNSFENLTTAEQQAVALGATEISNSWAGPESSSDSEYDSDFDHPGIPITAASGDDGYDNWELGDSVPSYPAVSPNVIAVGGTVLSRAGNSRGWSESVWSRSGSGCSLQEPKPSYQLDASCTHRTSNDVAAVAEDLSVYDTTHASGISGLPDWVTVDGTSASTPIIAAVEALSEPAERALGAEAFYKTPGSLFDIVSGSNGACAVLYLCDAGGGYDGPSGNGTPDGALSLSAPAPAPELTVRGDGTGSGSVSSSPAGIECASSCSASFAVGTKVTLTATPSAGSSFEGWQGPCSGTGACTVTLSSGSAATAVFRASGAPAGWAEATLASPGEREPFAAETSYESSFYNVSLSANGDVRVKTVFNPPSAFCYYASTDTGGVFLERREGSGWVSEGRLIAPAVGSESEARWANCGDFGEVTQLSGDGSTLLVSQAAERTYAAERCAAFVYRRGAHGWTLEATLFPPGIGATGTKTEEGCDYFGSQGAISDDGTHIAVMGNRDLYMFAREPSGWALEQQIVLPPGAHCNETVGVRTLALSGDASTVLVGKPDCETKGYFGDGSVYAYSRSGAGWSLSQTIESPEPDDQDDFGRIVSVSEDGSTAVVSSGRNLAGDQPAARIYERGSEGWRERAHLSDPTSTGDSGFGCSTIVAGGARVICGAYDTVGFNADQGAIYAFERPPGGWGSSNPSTVRLFATDGLPRDLLGRSDRLGWQGFGASADGSVIDAPISAFNIANGLYPDALIGYEFSGPSVYSAPTIQAISSTEGAAGATVTITGGNLLDASAVNFAGTPAASYDDESPTQITATVPAGASSGPISVTTPGGSATSAESFTVAKPTYAPELASVSPSEGPAAGGTAVVITGRHFVDGVSVTIGGSVSEAEVRSETEITAVTPAEPAGSYEVVVSDEAGSSTGGPTYTFLPVPPTVVSITPEGGPAKGGTKVTIRGRSFAAGATVTIGGRAAHVKVRSATEISAKTPAEHAGSYEVVVSDRDGSSSGGPTYTYRGPAVSTVTPSEGPTAGGTALTIRGSGFVAGAKVETGPVGKAASVHVVSGTEITAVTHAEPAGSYQVLVTEKLGRSTGGPAFTYGATPNPGTSAGPGADAADTALEAAVLPAAFALLRTPVGLQL